MEEGSVLRHRSSPGQPADNGIKTGDNPATTFNPEAYEKGSNGNEAISQRDGSFFKTTLRSLSGVTTLLPGRSEAEEEEHMKKQGFDRFKRIEYEKYPRGFPRLAAYMTSSDDMLVFRGFRYSFTRVLNRLQIEITELEAELYAIDVDNATDRDANYILDKEGRYTERDMKENTLKEKLKEYGDLFRNFRDIQAQGPALERNHRSFYNWMWQNRQLRAPNWDYMYHVDDFVPVNGNREGYVRNFVRNHLKHWPLSCLRKLLQGKHKTRNPDDKNQRYYDSGRIDLLVTFLLVSAVVGFLLVPALVFFLVSISHKDMAITAAIFVLLCAAVISTVTRGNVYEVFVGTSTYAAILTVFMGNVGLGTGSG